MLRAKANPTPNPNLNPNWAIINLKRHDVVHFSGRSRPLLINIVAQQKFRSNQQVQRLMGQIMQSAHMLHT